MLMQEFLLGFNVDMDDLEEHYRQLHERFVSNHTGTNPMEIVVVSTSVHLSLLLFAFFTLFFKSARLDMKDFSFFLPSSVNVDIFRTFLNDFSLVVIPGLLCLTCCSDPNYYFEAENKIKLKKDVS